MQEVTETLSSFRHDISGKVADWNQLNPPPLTPPYPKHEGELQVAFR